MQQNDAIEMEDDDRDFPMGFLLILSFQGAVWFGIGLWLGRALWGPAF